VVNLARQLLEQVAPDLGGAEEGVQPSDGQRTRALETPHPDVLSPREQEVLRLVAQGLPSKAIGQRLFISASTVNQHVSSIFQKLGVDTRAQAVAVAAQRGLL
jgi:DNA-binding NarL/FixJ family response regulator